MLKCPRAFNRVGNVVCFSVFPLFFVVVEVQFFG